MDDWDGVHVCQQCGAWFECKSADELKIPPRAPDWCKCEFQQRCEFKQLDLDRLKWCSKRCEQDHINCTMSVFDYEGERFCEICGERTAAGNLSVYDWQMVCIDCYVRVRDAE